MTSSGGVCGQWQVVNSTEYQLGHQSQDVPKKKLPSELCPIVVSFLPNLTCLYVGFESFIDFFLFIYSIGDTTSEQIVRVRVRGRREVIMTSTLFED